MTASCPGCGRPLSEHDRHIRFTLPDALVGHDVEEGTDGVWMSHASAHESVLLRVEGHGAFVRALVLVQLTGGYAVTFGVWVGLSREEQNRAINVWWSDELYPSLVLDGILANDIAPWNVLGVPVRLEVRDPEHTPYCASSSDTVLRKVLSDVWPHETVLAALPD